MEKEERGEKIAWSIIQYFHVSHGFFEWRKVNGNLNE
jgi:hypothetical protein